MSHESCSSYLKVVDCQYACPAHTPVPEYIRLIAQGKYKEAYLLNRDSNVFPGILGRICDRPCEPACRRTRVEKEPVAICRLKRVTADYKGDIKNDLPKIPSQKNGKRIALIGGGPASLTVANDLCPLGYEVHLFEHDTKAGGAIRRQVPQFRLPNAVLEEEINIILDFGVKTHFGCKIESLAKLLEEIAFDAVFLGTGAPIGRDLNLPGRNETGSRVCVGLNFLSDVSFEHLKSLEGRTLIIGGGNTAMDCARTARRLGSKEVTVYAPEAFDEMLASPWEIHDAKEEGISFYNHLLPKEFFGTSGQKSGLIFSPLLSAYDENRRFHPTFDTSRPNHVAEAENIILAIGQNTAFSYIDASLGLERLASGLLKVDKKTLQTSDPRIFVGGDASFGPKNIIQAVADGHQAAISMHLYCQSMDTKVRPEPSLRMVGQKISMNQWAYQNAYDPALREVVPTIAMDQRFAGLSEEVEKGFTLEQAHEEASRCLNCDIQTVFTGSKCIECDACVDICPVACLQITEDVPNETLRTKLSAKNPSQDVWKESIAGSLRVMVKDENYCIHCGLCAERCPTGAFDMQKSLILAPKAQGSTILKED